MYYYKANKKHISSIVFGFLALDFLKAYINTKYKFIIWPENADNNGCEVRRELWAI